MSSPRVVIGLPTYNHAEHLSEALDTLLGQQLRDLAIVLCDDGSTDDTVLIARRYAASDPRLQVETNERRLGLVGNWWRTFEVARRRWPDAPYFLPASDHDAWHPRFLSELVAALDARPDAVLAYPRNVRVGTRGEVIREPWPDRDYSAPNAAERLREACRTMVAGDMIYGLMRARAMAATRFHAALVPDRLLLAELACAGPLIQVPQTLWRRRYQHPVTAGRQRSAIFPGGTPCWAYLPWPLPHLALLGAKAVRGSDTFSGFDRRTRLHLLGIYTAETAPMHARGQANLMVNRLADWVLRAPRPVRFAVEGSRAARRAIRS